MQVQRDRALASSAPKDGYITTIGSPANPSPEATDEMSPVPENIGNWAAVKMRYSRLCRRPASSASGPSEMMT